MDFLVAGATGFLGRALVRRLVSHGHWVRALSRDPKTATRTLSVPVLAWDDETLPVVIEAADAVVNLTGESLAGARWNPKVKARLTASRIEPARRLAAFAPKVLIQASATGYYGAHGDEWIDESTPPGDDLLARMCVAWEDAARGAEAHGTRVVLLRIGQVLGRDGGVLDAYLHPPMLPFSPFKLGLGGPLGDRKAWMPWVHIDDVLGLIVRAAEEANARGPINVVAPNPVRQAEFAAALGRALHRPAVLPIPTFVLKLLLGEFAEHLSVSQRIRPAAAQKLGYDPRFPELDAGPGIGYRFRYPELDAALANLLTSPA